MSNISTRQYVVRYLFLVAYVLVIVFALFMASRTHAQTVDILPATTHGCPTGYELNQVIMNGGAELACVKLPPVKRSRIQVNSMRVNIPKLARINPYLFPNINLPTKSGSIVVLDSAGASYYHPELYRDRPLITIQPDGTKVTTYPGSGLTIREHQLPQDENSP
jgi:hypothetical protein